MTADRIAELETELRHTIAEGGDCTDIYAELDALREQIIDALDLRTAHEWNADPANTWRVMSWSDFNRPGEPTIGRADRITRSEFDRRKHWCSGVGRLTPEERHSLRQPRD